jgi:hypothetical protein
MSPILPKILLAGLVLIQYVAFGSAQEAQDVQQSATPSGVWWDWNVKREWSNNHRRAWGTIKLFSDPEKTKPITAENLRFSLELDCPISTGPELVINETSGASELNAEVRCAFGSDGKFEVRWQFEATDPRFGSVSDKGGLSK